MLHTCAGFTGHNKGQQSQQNPVICVYCGSVEHSSANCCRRPWDNREQPHDTPNYLGRNQPSNSEISGNTTGNTASTGTNTHRHPPQSQHQRSNPKDLGILRPNDRPSQSYRKPIIIIITGRHRDNLMQGLTKDTTRGTHPLYSHQPHH